MDKRINIGMKVLPWVVEAIDTVAGEEGRSRSNMIERMLLDWIREHRPELLKPEGE